MASSRSKRKQQARISFSPLPASSPAAKDYHPQIQERAAAVKYETVSSPAKRQRMTASDGRIDHEQHLLPTPEPTAPRGDDAEPWSMRKRDEQRRVQKRQRRLDLGPVMASSMEHNSLQEPASKKRSAVEVQSSAESDQETPQRRKRKRRIGPEGFMSSHRQRSSPAQATPPQKESTTPPPTEIYQDSSDDQSDMPTTLGSRRARQVVKSSQIRSSPPAIAISSDEDEIVLSRNRKGREKPRAREATEPSSEENSDSATTPIASKRRLKRRTQLTEQEHEELESDLEFLGNTSEADINSERQPRSTQNAKKDARLRALDALKRKRSGQPSHEGASKGTEEHEMDNDVSASDELDGSLNQDAYSDDYLFPSTAPTSSSRAMFEANEEDEGFLDDGEADDDALGVPEGIPIEFTRYASMKAKDLFKHAIEWMVQKKINPAFHADDELYAIAFKKLNDEVAGLVNSKFSSSAWTADFKQSLIARPDIETRELPPGFFLDHCEACNRKGHPASYEVQFTSNPYHPETLDAIEHEQDEDDTDDSATDQEAHHDDQPSTDYRGNKVPPADKVYSVGRFCMANAEMAHELHHWKLHLYDWVVRWLQDAGYNNPSKIVERDSWSTKKRRKHANKIADRMADEGVVRRLWKEFSDTITRARDTKPGRY